MDWQIIAELSILYCAIFTIGVSTKWVWELLKSEKPDPFSQLWRFYKQLLERFSDREVTDFGNSFSVSEINLDRILDDLDPLDKDNIEGEQLKNDYWWKVQKENNDFDSKSFWKWYPMNKNQIHRKEELLGVKDCYVEITDDDCDVATPQDDKKTNKNK